MSEDARPDECNGTEKEKEKETVEEEKADFGDDAGEEGGAKDSGVQEIGSGSEDEENKPSYTLHFYNVPASLELDDLETRLKRFGEVRSVEKADDYVVVKFDKTAQAYDAREKLDGSLLDGAKVKVKFGPQDKDHYLRGAMRQGRRGGRSAIDAELPSGKRSKLDGGAAGSREAFKLSAPKKPVSKWSVDASFEEQLEDFMKMDRKGMYNRYLVFGKLPPDLRTADSIRRMVPPAQRDIQRIEMIKCFGKPCAHISLRSAAAALSLHKMTEQTKPELTVAFAPPRRQSSTLWLGNIDDFVDKQELEKMLKEHGHVLGTLRYLPVKTCAFVTFKEASAAAAARNALYGLELEEKRYMNVDFVDEQENIQPEMPPGWGAPGPWGPPMPGPWGMMGKGMPPMPGKGMMFGKGKGPMPPWGMGPDPWMMYDPRRGGPPRFDEGGFMGKGGEGRMRSDRGRRRSRSRGRREEPQQRSRSRRRRRRADAEAEEEPDADEEPKPAEEPQAPSDKARVKLFKMGEFVCNCVATFVQGNEDSDPLVPHLQIDQRTKVDHCRSHMEKAGALVTTWHFSAADRRDCAAYDALCDYFVEKQRVGLVQTPSYYIYIVPPTKEFLGSMKLPESNFVVGLQIPVKK